jgi:hypothetical protein
MRESVTSRGHYRRAGDTELLIELDLEEQTIRREAGSEPAYSRSLTGYWYGILSVRIESVQSKKGCLTPLWIHTPTCS